MLLRNGNYANVMKPADLDLHCSEDKKKLCTHYIILLSCCFAKKILSSYIDELHTVYPDHTPNGASWFWFILFAILATKLH